MKDLYKKLAEHLDNLPGGYPATESGVELRILKRLFEPREAEIAMGLTLFPETASAIAARMNHDEQGMTDMLESMAKKGLINRLTKGGQRLFMALQFVVGIWEFQVNNLNEELIRDVDEFIPYLLKQAAPLNTQQMRVIPVEESLSGDTAVLPYDEVEKIIRNQSKIVVLPCICRRERQMAGHGCSAPLEMCMAFGTTAYFYEENGIGRSISQEEALLVLKKGIEAGLVMQSTNSQKPMNICMCCSCCCGILRNASQFGKSPTLFLSANYHARVTKEECTGCSVCEERCPMKAISIDGIASVDLEKCIGCGQCAVACSFDAIRLKMKEEAQRITPPSNTMDTYIRIMKEKGGIYGH
jgi:electron transport complex protein RnfB